MRDKKWKKCFSVLLQVGVPVELVEMGKKGLPAH